ncbi:hypothetical protein [Knoellia sp. LjRoot47]|uniref:hypothetical protein n=1 Tax=Knoellia sp. LjRoot47 TaxID=3342330 RepID=UPI003ED09DEF
MSTFCPFRPVSDALRTVDHVAHSCAVVALTPGDLITEIDTPGGPWYLIRRVDLERGVIVFQDGIEIPIEPGNSRVLRHSEQGLGIYRGDSCHDAESLAHYGQPYLEVNVLESVTRTTREVRFPDGLWLLAAPEDLTPLVSISTA